jgi:hypothetical protein
MADPLPLIRDQVHTILWAGRVLGAAQPESSYYEEYPLDLPEKALPALNFFFTEDELGHGDRGEYAGLAQGKQKRTATFAIEIRAKAAMSARGALNELHRIRRAVLKELATNRGLNGAVGTDFLHVSYMRTEWRFAGDREKPLVACDLTFDAYYSDSPQNDT